MKISNWTKVIELERITPEIVDSIVKNAFTTDIPDLLVILDIRYLSNNDKAKELLYKIDKKEQVKALYEENKLLKQLYSKLKEKLDSPMIDSSLLNISSKIDFDELEKPKSIKELREKVEELNILIENINNLPGKKVEINIENNKIGYSLFSLVDSSK